MGVLPQAAAECCRESQPGGGPLVVTEGRVWGLDNWGQKRGSRGNRVLTSVCEYLKLLLLSVLIAGG